MVEPKARTTLNGRERRNKRKNAKQSVQSKQKSKGDVPQNIVWTLNPTHKARLPSREKSQARFPIVLAPPALAA
jgi:hypothetical protein